jgi:hypothetical protein
VIYSPLTNQYQESSWGQVGGWTTLTPTTSPLSERRMSRKSGILTTLWVGRSSYWQSLTFSPLLFSVSRPPLLSGGQCSWLLTQRSRVRFPAQWVWNGVLSALVRINEELLERRVAAPVYKTEINGLGGIRRADHATPLYPQKLALNLAKKWRSLSRYSSFAD